MVELRDYFEDKRNIYLVKRFVSNNLKEYALASISSANDPQGSESLLTEEKACSFLRFIVKALHKLHSKLVVHRALRLESIKVRQKE